MKLKIEAGKITDLSTMELPAELFARTLAGADVVPLVREADGFTATATRRCNTSDTCAISGSCGWRGPI